VMGQGQKLLTRVGSGQILVARVGSGQQSLIGVWKISPLRSQFFLFGSKKISSGQVKKHLGQSRSASYLLRVKSMLELGQGPSLINIAFSKVVVAI